MQAIRLSERNFQTILGRESGVTLDELIRMLSLGAPGTRGYFIPKFTSIKNPALDMWVVMDNKTLYHAFTFDSIKIETEFVEITRR